METKRKTRRSGVVRVYDNAEMSSNFPKTRKLVKQYKFTVYADGRIVKTEIKNRKTRKKKSSKTSKRK